MALADLSPNLPGKTLQTQYFLMTDFPMFS